MLQRKFIRLNINDNYLSLGNVFRIIKEEANNTNMFLQSDLFAIILIHTVLQIVRLIIIAQVLEQ